ncbi:uncharacterized protein LOC115652704 [Gopherus evgoodei]|uniref:uncharacterized protein LOC115652704 n=1 Tax=Gopherus evgoodei TaxID=1825980 RepID=UPI0011CF5F08|nr:uncharacterized protein LOC115652704 [Gopherus evgoodei]
MQVGSLDNTGKNGKSFAVRKNFPAELLLPKDIYLAALTRSVRRPLPPCLYMAKFLAELLGCTLPDKGTSSMFESRSQSRIGLKQSTKQKTTTFSTLANEKSLSDRKWWWLTERRFRAAQNSKTESRKGWSS